jgi:hypothetical protein
MKPSGGAPADSRDARSSLFDLVMVVYLLSGALLLPLVLGEILVALGVVDAMNEQSMPSWLYGYTVLAMYLTVFSTFIAWLPALVVCVVFRNRWQVVLPAVAILAFTAGLLPLSRTAAGAALMNIGAVVYVFSATAVGIEWLVGRRR